MNENKMTEKTVIIVLNSDESNTLKLTFEF